VDKGRIAVGKVLPEKSVFHSGSFFSLSVYDTFLFLSAQLKYPFEKKCC
jgi:hypothetical protein